jgi:Zn-dependent protease with chaperone function
MALPISSASIFHGEAMIAAHFFDGRSARLHPAELEVQAGQLRVATDAFERRYPLDGLQLAEPFAAAPAVLRFHDGASCEVPAGEARRQLLEAIGYRKSPVVRWQERWPVALVALVLLLVLLALLYFRVLPFAAERIAASLPPSIDTRIGQSALAALEAKRVLQPSRLSDERIAEVRALLPQVLPRQPRMPVRLLVRNAPSMGANALALPDGTIVVTDWMVRLVQNRRNELTDKGKQQLIAVIGHEVGHIQRRHGARVLASSSLTAALSATLFGDFSAVAAGVPALLTQMEYSRRMEAEADAYAVGILRHNRIPVQAFIDVLGKLERQHKEDADMPSWMKTGMNYLSTHPATEDRIESLQDAAADEEEAERLGGKDIDAAPPKRKE